MCRKNVNIQQDKSSNKILSYNVKLSEIIQLDIIVGWAISLILVIIEEIFNCGLRFFGVFIVFFVIQIFNYINLLVVNENRVKLYSFFWLSSIPLVGLSPIGLIYCIPLAFNF